MGSLFENMVVVEALKARLNAGLMQNLYFYRDAKGNEVDLILRQHRKLRPVEIKAAMTFSPEMTKGIMHFQKQFTDALPGAVIYAGDIETKSEVTHMLNFYNTSELVEI